MTNPAVSYVAPAMAPNTPYPQRVALDLDGAVRAVGNITNDPAAADAAVDALCAAWTDTGSVPLRLAGAAVAVADEPALSADGEHGQWIWPAAAAGLRRVQPRSGVDPDAYRELVEQLAALDRSDDAVRTFRRWLWAGGNGAFDFDVGPALADRLGGIAATEGARSDVDNDRLRFVQQRTVAFARRQQGRDALAEQADARIATYLAELTQGTLTLTGAAATELRFAAEDGDFWTRQLAEVIASNDGLRAATAAERAARLVLETFRHGPTFDAIATVHGLQPEAAAHGGAAADESDVTAQWLVALRHSVSDSALGKATGRGVALDAVAVARLNVLMRDTATPFSVGVATGLLERAGGGDEAVKAVAQVCKAVGMTQVWSLAELSGLSDGVARGIAQVLKLCDEGADKYADLVVACPATVAAWILRNAPPHVRSRIESRLHQVFRSRDPTENTPLVEALIATESPSSMKALGEVLLKTRGAGWAGRIVPDLCAAIVKARLAGEFLVPLFRDREADTMLRLLVLRSMDAEPDLLAEATKFRVTDVMEPKEIQARCKAIRRRLKEAG